MVALSITFTDNSSAATVSTTSSSSLSFHYFFRFSQRCKFSTTQCLHAFFRICLFYISIINSKFYKLIYVYTSNFTRFLKLIKIECVKFGWNIKFIFSSATAAAAAAATPLLPRITTTTIRKGTMSNHKETIKYKCKKTVGCGS